MKRWDIAFIVGIIVGVCLFWSAETVFGSTADPSAPQKYWQMRGCTHGHPTGTKKGSYAVVKRVLRHHYSLNKQKASKLPHYAVCVATRAKSKAVWDFIRRSHKWRKLYEHKWWIKFHSLPLYLQNWAWSTGSCESGNDPNKNTGNGFIGAHQWLPGTWRKAIAALGWNGPWSPLGQSWPLQAYVTVRWLLIAGDEQWPNCGEDDY